MSKTLSPAVTIAVQEAITTQEILVWWAGHVDNLLHYLSQMDDKLYFRYYGGFALNVLEGQLRGAPKGDLQAAYNIGTMSIGYPASDIDVQVYGVSADEEKDAALWVLSKLAAVNTSKYSFEDFPESTRSWILNGMPIPGIEADKERRHQYVMLRTFKPREAPVKYMIAKLHPYKVDGIKHYQIQIAGVMDGPIGLVDLTQLSFVQTPFPKHFVHGLKVFLHDPWTLLKQFSTLYDAIKDMPAMDERIVKTARRIEVADGMVTHFEELERKGSQRAAQLAAQRSLAELERSLPPQPLPPTRLSINLPPTFYDFSLLPPLGRRGVRGRGNSYRGGRRRITRRRQRGNTA